MSTFSESAPLDASMLSTQTLLSQPRPPLPPTLATLTAFLSTFFPLRPRDVPFEYHVPRTAFFNPAKVLVSDVVFSITATPGVYAALKRKTPAPAVAFLHRPFGLDRYNVRRGSTVLSSHVGFDEVLTVGWNTVLAARLDMEVEHSACLQGYKGDPDRRIGIVGGVTSTVGKLLNAIKVEFGTIEGLHGAVEEDEDTLDQDIGAVAIMNAFHPEEIDRVLTAAYEKGWIDGTENGSEVLYLTGQAREAGLIAAMAKGLKVVCVGHRTAEEWGIRYLAERTRAEFPMTRVEEVYEDEEPRPPRPPKQPPKPQNGAVVESSQG